MVAAENAFAALGLPVQAPKEPRAGGGGGAKKGKGKGGKGAAAAAAAAAPSKKAQKKAERKAEAEREAAAADRGGFETVVAKGSAGGGGGGGARAALFLALADQASSGAPPGWAHLASAVEQASGSPMTGAEEAALRKLLFALPGGGDGARAKALAGAIAAAAKLAASAPKAAGPEAARALGGAAALAVQRLAAPGAQQARPPAAAAAAAPPPEASDAPRASLRAAGDARSGARLVHRSAASATLLQQQTLRLEAALGVGAAPKPAAAGAGGGPQAAFGSFQEAEDVLDLQGKRDARRRLSGDRDSAVAEAARLNREITQAEAKVASLKARRQALQDQISGGGADPRAAQAADAHDQEALALLRAMEAAVPGAPAPAKRTAAKGAPSAASQADSALTYVKVVREVVLAKQAAQQVLRRRLRFCVEQLAAVEADLEVADEVPDAEAVEAVRAIVPKLEEMLSGVLAEGAQLEAEASALGKSMQRLLGLLPGSAKGKCRADADFCRTGFTQITQFQSLLSAEATRRLAQPEEYYAAATSLADEPEPAPSGAGAEPAAVEESAAAEEGGKPAAKPAKGGGKPVANGKPKANPWNKLATMEANGKASNGGEDASGLLDGPPLS